MEVMEMQPPSVQCFSSEEKPLLSRFGAYEIAICCREIVLNLIPRQLRTPFVSVQKVDGNSES